MVILDREIEFDEVNDESSYLIFVFFYLIVGTSQTRHPFVLLEKHLGQMTVCVK